ncbi:hypothetical protein AFL01nite_21760 [Aeromicrobium flavum]|uniref:Uncharacterized protein n=1 Tax=Aeromicrobium flavum TaxID=416568 RepID=A0A512HWN3_9ACTN|nr:hypothetical protein AFL01nite_21760 [Aeromicrobium flavum]
MQPYIGAPTRTASSFDDTDVVTSAAPPPTAADITPQASTIRKGVILASHRVRAWRHPGRSERPPREGY